MAQCLNPRKSHENREVVDSSLEAEAGSSEAIAGVAVAHRQVTCQFCKYLLAGAILGDCRVNGRIGSVAFGDVYEAQQLPPLNRRVAIKVMSLDRVSDGQSAEAFAREVGTIAALDHPNILPVLRVGMLEDGRSYLVMKYAAHGSLQKYCQTTPQDLSILPTSRPPKEEIEATKELAALATLEADASRNAEQANISPSEDQEERDEKAEEEDARSDEPSEQQEPVIEDALTLEADIPSPEDKGELADDEDAYRTRSIHDLEVVSEQEQELPTISGVEQETLESDVEASPEQSDAEPATYEGQLLTPQQLLPYVKSAAEALYYAHTHNLIHLDVKPANLLLDGEDRLLLADFGVSAILDGYTHASLHCYVGTPAYTAPEQWFEQPRPASDQYALAVTCYQLLTGRLPFIGNLYSIMHGHLQTPPPPLREFNPLVSQQVEAVIQRALAKEPSERYEDMLAFARAYQDAVESAASAQTGVEGQQHTAQLAARDLELADAPTLHRLTREEPATLVKTRDPAGKAVQVLENAAPATKDVWEPPEAKLRPPEKKRSGRILLLGLLILILLTGSLFGAIRIVRPCLMGVCPALRLSTNEVDITNSDSQSVRLSNPGTAPLSWHILGSATWLTYKPASGDLAPGASTLITIITNANNLPNGVDSTELQVTGQYVIPQVITVRLTVQTGLSEIGVKVSGNSFVYDASGLHPASQTLTITNKSAQDFSWSLSYGDNTWLRVTPDQDTVPHGKSESLKVTATIPPNLPSSITLITKVIINGQLANQVEQSYLTSFEFTLKVYSNSSVTPSVPNTPTPTPTPLTFSAQQITSPSAPTIARSGHSMVWDSQDDLIFVFGGIDNSGNLLNDLWQFDPAAGQWTNLFPSDGSPTPCANSSRPAARMNAAMVWDDADRQILLYGGAGANNHFFGDLWSYSPAQNTWKALACSNNGPGPRLTNAVWNGSQMLLLGGEDKYGPIGDFWAYTPGNNGNWQRLVPPPTGPRAFQMLTWDATDGKLFVFGGLDASGAQHDDFYFYSSATGWQTITPASASNPKIRQQAIGVWNSKDNVLLMIGGWQPTNNTTPYYGLWAYDPKQNTWDLVTPLNSDNQNIIPGITASAMVWDAKDQEAFIYAGAGSNAPGNNLNGLWEITG